MTNQPCTYCGEHHRYEHELVCDHARHNMYPLWNNKAVLSEAVEKVDNSTADQIKGLKNDYILLNTKHNRLLELIKSIMDERCVPSKRLRRLKTELYKLKTPD